MVFVQINERPYLRPGIGQRGESVIFYKCPRIGRTGFLYENWRVATCRGTRGSGKVRSELLRCATYVNPGKSYTVAT
jgi:hypothetical protein